MLVLTRKPNETIVIGDAEVMVLEIHQGSVKLGIAAPREVPVWRKELGERPEDDGEGEEA